MTIIRLSSVFVLVIVATKVAVFTADDAKMYAVEWLAELEHEVDELIDEAVRYRGERREVVEHSEGFARSLRRDAVRFAIELVLGVRSAGGEIRRNMGEALARFRTASGTQRKTRITLTKAQRDWSLPVPSYTEAVASPGLPFSLA